MSSATSAYIFRLIREVIDCGDEDEEWEPDEEENDHLLKVQVHKEDGSVVS